VPGVDASPSAPPSGYCVHVPGIEDEIENEVAPNVVQRSSLADFALHE